MAVVALNKFRTIRYNLTTTNTGIYTCPIGVASIIILSQVTNTSSGIASVSAFHSRTTEFPSDYSLANQVPIPPNDGYNIVSDGRLVLETNDVIKVQSTSNNSLTLVLSILETAKQ
jgi:hypothetical protein